MPNAPAQPSRPFIDQACLDAAGTLRDQFVLAAFLPEGAALPGDGEELPTVRLQVVVRPTVGGIGSGRVGGNRVGLSGFGAGGLTQGRPEQTRATSTCRVFLARLGPSVDVSDAEGGVLDPGDGLGGRVVRLKTGDRFYVPGSCVGRPDATVELTVRTIATDETCWLAEVSL